MEKFKRFSIKKILFFTYCLNALCSHAYAMEAVVMTTKKPIPEQHHYVIPVATNIVPYKTIQFFDHTTTPYPTEEMRKTNLKISPDGKEIIASQRGRIFSISTMTSEKPKLLFEHRNITKLPTMLTLDQAADGSLIVTSAGNYYDKETLTRKSEIIIYRNGEGKTKKLSKPIDAITSSLNGTLLIISQGSDIILFNSQEETYDEACVSSTENCIKPAISMLELSKKDSSLIVATHENFLELYGLHKNHTTMQKVKQYVNTGCTIKALGFPTEDKIVVASTNQAFTISLYDLLNPPENRSILSLLYNAQTGYNQMAVDEGNITVASWTNNPDSSAEDLNTIHICRAKTPNVPSTIGPKRSILYKEYLELSGLLNQAKWSTHINNHGREEREQPHFVTVTLAGSIVAALSSNGAIDIWQIPHSEKEENASEPATPDLTTLLHSPKEVRKSRSPNKTRFAILSSSQSQSPTRSNSTTRNNNIKPSLFSHIKKDPPRDPSSEKK
jgi:hypothetical protein